MNTDASSYNLLDEPWIELTTASGTTRFVSLVGAFEGAHEARGIAGEMPQMAFATLRLLLAILYRAYAVYATQIEDPRLARALWRGLWKQGRFDMEEITPYLEAHRDGFYLIDSDRPFFQTANLVYTDKAEKEYGPIAELMPDVPKPDKHLFSMRSPEGSSSLSMEEAARYLVLAQAYDIAGIRTPVVGNTHVNKGKVYAPKGAVGTGWCGAIGGTFLEGNNLFETLLINFVLFDKRNDNGCLLGIDGDIPPWERESPSPDLTQVDPCGPAQMLTWQGRRIRLVPDESRSRIVGAVICYGDITNAIDKQDCEMMTPWRASLTQQKKLGLAHIPWLPRQHDPRRSIWRGLAALLSVENEHATGAKQDLRPGIVRWIGSLIDDGVLDQSYRLSICAQGMSYGAQNSAYEDAVDDSINMYALMVRSDAAAVEKCVEVVEQTEEAVNRLSDFVAEVEMAHGDKRRYDKFTDAVASAVKDDMRERAYDELDGLFRARIARFTADVDPLAYCNQWRADVLKILLDLSDEYLASTGASLFEERINAKTGKPFSAGSASAKLRVVLARILPSKAGSDDVSRNDE